MARYKHYDYGQMKMLPVSFERQILPGTFEHTLNRLIEEDFDLSVFEARYRNDETGAPAYDPAILLKIILLAYARGVTASREIERLLEGLPFELVTLTSWPAAVAPEEVGATFAENARAKALYYAAQTGELTVADSVERLIVAHAEEHLEQIRSALLG